jgi:hypothetical protein
MQGSNPLPSYGVRCVGLFLLQIPRWILKKDELQLGCWWYSAFSTQRPFVNCHRYSRRGPFWEVRRGVLTVTVVRAENLLPSDFNGKADPYVVLRMYRSFHLKKETKVVNLQPLNSPSCVGERGNYRIWVLPLIHLQHKSSWSLMVSGCQLVSTCLSCGSKWRFPRAQLFCGVFGSSPIGAL